VAASETEVRVERILAGQSAARDRGVHWGGSRRGRRIKVTGEHLTDMANDLMARADHYERLKARYLSAARHPWLPIESELPGCDHLSHY
jgi:DNA invertase Pin-like site-specific DNA recombinase